MNEQSERNEREVRKFFRRLDFFRQLFTVGVYGVFLMMKMVRGSGYFAIHLGLFIVNAVYAVAVTVRYFMRGGKTWKRRINDAYRWMKVLFSFFAVGITVYSIVTAVNTPTSYEITFAILNVAAFLFKVFNAVLAIILRRIFAKIKRKMEAKRAQQSEQKERGKLIGWLRWLYFGEERPVRGEETAEEESLQEAPKEQ